MPTAALYYRNLMERWFGSPVDDSGPTRFLLSHGFTEHGGMWRKPCVSHSTSCFEATCLIFLIQEWDHGFYESQTLNPICLCGLGFLEGFCHHDI